MTSPNLPPAGNQPIKPEGRAKADLVVITRAKEFKRTPPNQERKKAFRILKRLATSPIQEDQASTEDYQQILKDLGLGKGGSRRARHRSDYKQEQQAREVDRSNATREQEGQDNQPRHMVIWGSGKGSEDHWGHRPEWCGRKDHWRQ